MGRLFGCRSRVQINADPFLDTFPHDLFRTRFSVTNRREWGWPSVVVPPTAKPSNPVTGSPTLMWIHRLGLEHAKQYLLTGRSIDAPTALRIGLVSETHPADQLSTAAEAEARRLATIPANQLALNKLLINQAYESMGLRTTQMLGTFFDGIARHTEEALRWAEDINQRGLRDVIADRDRPWQDYGLQP